MDITLQWHRMQQTQIAAETGLHARKGGAIAMEQ
ncbi:hypothetical protein N183_29715 [Sinorhizobium sp. Sb3]|jgi:hypothetical protein|nr:hypothetical protein N183_29715 [Sinorhizobium sp. Sb3]